MECELCGMSIPTGTRLCKLCTTTNVRDVVENKKELRLRKPHWVRYNAGPDKSGYLLVVRIGQTTHNIADIIRVGTKWHVMRFGHTVPALSFVEREGFETLGAAKHAVADAIKEIAKAL